MLNNFVLCLDPQESTFLQSCGFADLVTTCYGGRNRKIGIALSNTTKSLAELEVELMGGQSAQGPITAEEVYVMLKSRNLLDRYPIFDAVHQICIRKLEPIKIIDYLVNHPEHR